MIKCETVGMFEIAKLNPVIQSASAVKNYTFLTDNGIVYLICNTTLGDDAYKDEVTYAAGEYLNGYQVDVWAGQKLIVDEKHIKYGVGETYASITPGTTLMTIDSTTGKLEIAQSAPASGVYFKVLAKTNLTEKAIKVIVIVVDKDTVPSG